MQLQQGYHQLTQTYLGLFSTLAEKKLSTASLDSGVARVSCALGQKYF